MCNKDDLVSYLYDDLDGAARLAFERHLRDCAECRDELAAMRAVRADLLTWSPPEPDFAFRIVQEPLAAHARNELRAATAATVLRPTVPSWRASLTPAAGLAAAAVLVLAAAAGLARVEVHSGPDGWTLRTGASSAAVQSASGYPGLQARDVNLALDAGADPFAALDRRIAALETASHDGSHVRNASLDGRSHDAELLKLVKDLLAQSESSQRRELAMRMAQLIRDVDAQRVADLNRVQTGIRSIDQNVAADAAQHREMINILLSSNSKQK